MYIFLSVFEDEIWGSKKTRQKTILKKFINNANKGFLMLYSRFSYIWVKTSRAKRNRWELTAKYSSSFTWKKYMAPILTTKRASLRLRFIFCFYIHVIKWNKNRCWGKKYSKKLIASKNTICFLTKPCSYKNYYPHLQRNRGKHYIFLRLTFPFFQVFQRF